ncbi:MAG: cytochrome-c peroxidase [Candidatus Kapaibacteriota bacterium]
MMKAVLLALLLASAAVGGIVGCSKPETTPEETATLTVEPLTPEEEETLLAQAKALFGVLPDMMPGASTDTPELVALGEKLYNETQLSATGTQSCNSCHMVDGGKSGVDNLPTSPGAHGTPGTRNSPTVLNAGFHFVQFWDGRAADLVEQAKGPILNPAEMAMASEKDVEDRLSAIDEYKTAFAAAFPQAKQPITYHNVATAIAAFERTLVSKSRYDDYVSGTSSALTDVEKRGLQTFISTGCITCHVSPTFGGSMYQKLGLVNPYDSKDAGRYEVTKDPADSLMFKVPSLRNVALTAPYYHDGSIPTLDSAVTSMAWHQLGRKLETKDRDLIVAFLSALSDPSRKLAAQ